MLALQINNQWAVLSEEQPVTIEENSPVWGEGNTFSLPFELDVEANRHILGNSDQLTGMSVYDVLEGQSATLYVMGIPLFYGKLSLEDEVEIENGTVEVSLISSTLAFDDMIDGMKCQDVELKEEIAVGTGVNGYQIYDRLTQEMFYWKGMPKDLMTMSVNGVSTVNVSVAYPSAKYCNTRIMYKKPDKDTVSGANELYGEARERGIQRYEVEKYDKYIVLEADRPMSGLCFFVLYFLECLFTKLQVSFDFSEINGSGDPNNDINRLAFFSTRFSCDSKETGNLLEYNDIKAFEPTFVGPATNGRQFNEVVYVANSKNFPDADVSDVVNSLVKGFGVRFLYSPKIKHVQCVYVRDVLRSSSIKELNSVEIIEAHKIENAICGLSMKYSSANEEDTAFNYSDWNNIESNLPYKDIKGKVAPYNQTLYISPETGNAYRIKVNEEAKLASELQPSLFKVAQFNKVEYGDCSDDKRVESIEVPFSPIVQNDVSPKENEPTYATLVDESLLYPSMKTMVVINAGSTVGSFNYSYYSAQRTSAMSSESHEYITKNNLPQEVEYAFQSEPGLTLGIMRGPGADASIKDYDENYDGENNSKYMNVAANYAFHSDTIDDNGGEFDYNGETDGGTGAEDGTGGRFSLYLRAEKPNPNGGYFDIGIASARRRGLFDKFYAEYAYFVVNRKIVRMKCRMEMADLLNIDWTKRYKIGEYVGFINKYSYSVSSTGISDVELEMYYI